MHSYSYIPKTDRHLPVCLVRDIYLNNICSIHSRVSIYLTGLVSGSELETSVKFSRSQKRTRRSAPPDASRNSCGWNSTSVTGAVCSFNSTSSRPARKSQICLFENAKKKKKKTGRIQPNQYSSRHFHSYIPFARQKLQQQKSSATRRVAKRGQINSNHKIEI